MSTLTEYGQYAKDVNGESKTEEVNKPIVKVKENKVNKDEKGDLWTTTPRGLRFPKAKKRNHQGFERLPYERTTLGRFCAMYPEVSEWLESFESFGTKDLYGNSLRRFCVFTDMTPKEFGELWRSTEDMVKARQLVTKYIRLLARESPAKANNTVMALKSFFRIYSSGFQLPLDTARGGALEIKESIKAKFRRIKYNWGELAEFKKKVKGIIGTIPYLQKRTAITFLYRTGVRNNVLDHITVGDVQDYIEINETKILCLTITPKLDFKLRNLVMRLPTGETGYYTFLAGNGLELFKRYMEQHHANSPMDKPLFRHKPKRRMGKLLSSPKYTPNLRDWFNGHLERIGYPSKQIWLHHLRALFNQLAHTYCETNRAEFLSGHKLKGVQEHYQWRNKNDLAKEYLKINFEPKTEEEARLTKKVQDVEERLKKLEGVEESIVPETPKTPEQPTQPKAIGKVMCPKDGKNKSTKECEQECNEWVSCSPYARAMELIWKKEEEHAKVV